LIEKNQNFSPAPLSHLVNYPPQAGWQDWANFRLCIGWLFTLGTFCENYSSSSYNRAAFSTIKVMYEFNKRWIGLQFGRLFQNRIWSPWT
jgi:hypothetical protein